MSKLPADLGSLVAARLRELRLERELEQAAVAHQLHVSPAYLNLIEKGKRTVPFPLLWKLLKLYEQDPEAFMARLGDGKVDATLAKLLDEPLLRSVSVDADTVRKLSAEPRLAGTVAALFNLYKNTRSQLDQLVERGAGGSSQAFEGTYSPFDEVTDLLQERHNWFPELEAEADRLRRDQKMALQVRSSELAAALRKAFGVRAELVDFPAGSSVIRKLDAAGKTLSISRGLTEQFLKFQLGASAGLLVLDRLDLTRRLLAARREPLRHAETERLFKINLANYFAGALLLPYKELFAESQRTRYDVELLSTLFAVTYETVAHRICNLGDPRRRGVPFHFLRADVAGNFSKRYSGTGLRLAERGGSCPKWAVHGAFLNPSALTRQYSTLPDGSSYFCFAKVMAQPAGGSLVRGTLYSIGLGVQARDARHLAYADDMPIARLPQLTVPAGVTCRFCERTDCNQRAAPSHRFAFAVDEYVKKDSFFSPLLSHEAGKRGRP
ncbi:MAG: helix-turn-helix domain-containing protein [Myxococcales bacterium]